MKYILRDYQIKAADVAVKFFKSDSKNNGIMVLPTGSGKSLILAEVANQLHEKILILQPTKEILEQNYAKYLSYGYQAAIYSASFNKKQIGPVTFAMIGSIVRKKELFSDFKYIAVDEAHYCNAKKGMYKEFLSFVNKKVLGLTATPYRLTHDGYGGSILKFITRTRPRIFKELLYYVQIRELLEKGYLAKVEYETDNIFDSSKIRLNSTGADFVDESLQEYCDSISQNDRTIHAIKTHTSRKGIISFVPFVKDAEYISENIDRAAILSTKTSKKDRENILRNFRSGEVKAIVNVGILNIGFDYPELDTIILSRPTMSLALWYQMIGRGIRPHPEKDCCLVVDLTDSCEKFGKIEDLVLYENNNKPFIGSGNRQLTNAYFSENKLIETKKVMPFGKHKGTALKDIDHGYLTWVLENCKLYGELKQDIKIVMGVSN